MRVRKSIVSLLSILLIILSTVNAFAISEAEKTFLSMYFKEEELVVLSATRSLKSITRVAENVEVVTKDDIELMNAHTLVDVLNTINGVAIGFAGSSIGSAGSPQIQGSRMDHVIILVDGVNINDIPGGVAPTEFIPVQMIEKVEVIKGPASSVWGSSLGGIINVITKMPISGSRPEGTVSGSYGKKDTADVRAELSGTTGGLGYYLFAGRLQTDGLRPRDSSWHNSIYSKFTYDFSKDTSANLSLFYNRSIEAGGDFDSLGYRYDSKYDFFISSLSVKSRLSDSLSVEVAGRMLSKTALGLFTDLASSSVTEIPGEDKKYGGSIKFDLKQGAHTFVFGGDYDHLRTKFSTLTVGENIAALYVNDSIHFGKLTVIPGLRFDNIDIKDASMSESILSPSLGATYEIAEKTLLRAVVAKGFSAPPIFNILSDSLDFRKNPNLKTEKVWSYQAGIETGALEYLWMKVSGFRHDVRDAMVREDISVDEGTWSMVNKSRVRRQGAEVEVRTLPFYNFTLKAAASYIHTEDLETGETVQNNPSYTYNVGLQYDDKKTFRALLSGYHVWWNATPDMNAKYNAVIVDLNLTKKLYKKETTSVEAFMTGHNLFNGSSYWLEYYKNANRWVEAGIRVKF